MTLKKATLTTMDMLESLASAQAIESYELIYTPDGTVLDAILSDGRRRLCVARGTVRYFKKIETAIETLARLGETRVMIEFPQA